MRRSVNKFREKRAGCLKNIIKKVSGILGRPLKVLDVGGQAPYWENVGTDNIDKIILLNSNNNWLEKPVPKGMPEEIFERRAGDARNLSDYGDKSVDLLHSNSVIEHVGSWTDMVSMASEVIRVGWAGWIQTPAWEFPVEPHFRAPFMHWFGRPLQASMMSISFDRSRRSANHHVRRRRVERINLLSKQEVKLLFPNHSIYVERLFLLPKSYSVHWLPEKRCPGARAGGRMVPPERLELPTH
jgi:hypothetical protein